jgi:LacI family transcriptional regulator
LAETHDDIEQELKVVKTLQRRRVDGIFLAPATSGSSPALEYLLQLGVPTVLVDRFASDNFDQVGTENRDAIATLVMHIAKLGHNRIGMVAGLRGIQTTEERLEGYKEGLRRCAIPYDPNLVKSGKSAARTAEHAVYRLLALDDKPTALIAGNNAMTIGTLRALRRRNLKISADMALGAFDDFEWADLMQPRLTTIAQPIGKIGEVAAELMRTRLANPSRRPREVRLKPTFMDRESCGCVNS